MNIPLQEHPRRKRTLLPGHSRQHGFLQYLALFYLLRHNDDVDGRDSGNWSYRWFGRGPEQKSPNQQDQYLAHDQDKRYEEKRSPTTHDDLQTCVDFT
jgi:hypothetical protein